MDTVGGLVFFCNHFEELQTALFEVEPIINNKPLTYVYQILSEHVLHPVICYFQTIITVRNLTVLSSTTDKINRISNHFLNRWRHGYVVSLRETQRTSKLNTNSLKLMLMILY